MTNSADSSFVDAVLDEAKRKAAADPNVRGGDFRYVTVTAVNSNGTVSIGDIRARRHTSYTAPAVGDRIIIMQSGNRNWVALGRLSGTDNAGATWTTIPLASGYAAAGGGVTPAYMLEGKRVWLRGRCGPPSGTITNGATIATIPAAARPAGAALFGWASPRNQISTGSSLTRVEIDGSTGIVRTYEQFSAPSWIAFDGVTYLTD